MLTQTAKTARRTAAAVVLSIAVGLASEPALGQEHHSDTLRTEILEGREMIFSGRYDDALSKFGELVRRYPASPAGDFYQAVTLIWKSIVDAKLDSGARTYDGDIEASLAATIRKAEALRAREDKSEVDVNEALYYLGSAHAIRSRLALYQNHAIPAARAARTAQDSLDDLIKLKPDFYDAYFANGGIYYRVGLLTDSPIGRVASAVLGPKSLPAGDRERGIAYLKTAAERAPLADVDAKFALLEVLTLNESRFDEALVYARELQAKYPDNQMVARYLLRIYSGLKDKAKLRETAAQIIARVKQGKPNFGTFMKTEAERFLADAGKM
ncbi:MAG TPA: hypothetical protein VJH03_14605 [Blastocatellia bacterium]|nr:hypothetical protein [Blastocatellia bacterium]